MLRLAVRRELATPLVAELEQWLREQRAALSRHTPVAKAINYMLGDWTAFTRGRDREAVRYGHIASYCR